MVQSLDDLQIIINFSSNFNDLPILFNFSSIVSMTRFVSHNNPQGRAIHSPATQSYVVPMEDLGPPVDTLMGGTRMLAYRYSSNEHTEPTLVEVTEFPKPGETITQSLLTWLHVSQTVGQRTTLVRGTIEVCWDSQRQKLYTIQTPMPEAIPGLFDIDVITQRVFLSYDAVEMSGLKRKFIKRQVLRILDFVEDAEQGFGVRPRGISWENLVIDEETGHFAIQYLGNAQLTPPP